jgi:tRNA dimethylallyltransferase
LGAGKEPLHPRRIVLVGATASGKSDVALELAERLGGEIVGADSRQIYRGLEIGTEAPTREDRARVPHHFVAFLDPAETYSAGRYGHEARAAIRDIESRGKLPIVAGGSGLYIRALLQGLFHGPARDAAVRARLTSRIREEGLEALRQELGRVDPEALAGILPGDPVRVVRALEVHELTGRPISALRRERAPEPLPALLFGLRWTRPALADRIASRFDRQLARGFLDEVKRLLATDLPEDSPGPRTLGYRELIAHLRGDSTLGEARAQIALKTRQLAKRQETWFRFTPGVTWIELHSPEDLGRAAREIEDLYRRSA